MSKRLRILYADDMKELRDIVAIGLEAEGHIVECVEDGAAAYQTVASDPKAFDVVISDHHMPRMNGLALVRRLRDLPFPGKLFIFSSELSEEVSAAYAALSVDMMLFKPVELSLLRRLMREMAAGLPSETVLPAAH